MLPKKFCAHRGVSALMPENTLPAFAAALALGAEEIEFDVRLTKDGRLVVSHDENLERISNGTGLIREHTLEELKQRNIGGKEGWEVPFCTPEEVFEQLAGRITFNIHLKEAGEEGALIRQVADLIHRYGVEDKAYFAGGAGELAWMERVAPEITRVAIQGPRDSMEAFAMATQYHCSGVQFWLGMFDRDLIDRFHQAGMFCNLYFADDAAAYEQYFAMGMDTLLTNRMDLAAHWRRTARK